MLCIIKGVLEDELDEGNTDVSLASVPVPVVAVDGFVLLPAVTLFAGSIIPLVVNESRWNGSQLWEDVDGVDGDDIISCLIFAIILLLFSTLLLLFVLPAADGDEALSW